MDASASPPPEPVDEHLLPWRFPHALQVGSWRELLPASKRRLGIFMLFAALFHLLAFLTVQIVYPPLVISKPDRAQVMFEPAEDLSPADLKREAYWSSLLEPSLLIMPRDDWRETTVVLSEPHLPPVARVRSRPEPLESEGITLLPTLAAGQLAARDLMPERRPFSSAEANLLTGGAPAPSVPLTRIEWGDSLRELLRDAGAPLPTPRDALPTVPAVTVVRLGVAPSGAVEHALIEQSSGQNTLDDLAIASLKAARFARRAEPGTIWGAATVYWQFSAPERKTPVKVD